MNRLTRRGHRVSRSKEKSKKKKNDMAADDAGQAPVARSRRRSRRMGDMQKEEQSSMSWLISFTDVMALMLTFFVLLFSMTEPAKQDWSELSSALQSEFNRFYGALHNRGPVETVNLNRINFNQALNLPYLSVLLESVMAENEQLANVRLIRQQDTLILALPQDLLFDPGSAQVKDNGARALYALGGALSRIKNTIEINGHADPRPISGTTSEGHSSNWELSLARAAQVAAMLNTVGYQKEIAIYGYSSGRYDDLTEIEDENERLDLARRVDIVLMSHDGARQKVFFNIESE